MIGKAWRLNHALRFCATAIACVALGEVAGGQSTPPDLQPDYRFHGWSVLEEHHVGTEQPDFQYRVYGTFGIALGKLDDDPWMGMTAQFVDVNAWFHNPLSAAPPQSLDDALNLSNLEGHQLPVAAPFDVYQFIGKTATGSDVNLFARFIGPWILLSGGTSLPTGQTIGVEYELDAIARQFPVANGNDDAVVDRLDLQRMIDNFGSDAFPAALSGDIVALGDATHDWAVDGADVLAWQNQLGEQTPGSPPSIAAAPEPGTAALVLAGFFVLEGCSRGKFSDQRKLAGV